MMIRYTYFSFVSIGIMGTFLAGAFFFCIHYYIIDVSILSHYHSYPSVLLDDEGNEWARFQLDKKDPIDDSDLPIHVINAFIAAEDWDFFKHNGISYKGIIRSILVNIYYGRKAQGASTITQQLVKLLFFDSRKTFTRKIKEQLYALLIETQLTKKQILYIYLNNVCFGCGIYGIEAASQRFWGKHAFEISIHQAATLAGIIRSPARYCPLVHPLSAQKRRDVVLKKMNYLGFISDQEYEEALAYTVEIEDQENKQCAPHLKEALRVELEKLVGKKQLYTSGLSIQTTLNKKMQICAEKVFKAKIVQLRKEFGNTIDGGMIVIDRKTGEIKAMVGGFDFSVSKFNRATQARRQIGSLFKPLIYAVAIEEGRSFAETEIDEPTEWVQNNTVWAPKNYNKKFNGQITLAYALSHSNNIVAIKTFLKTNPHRVLSLAKKCGIKNITHTYPSLALGCVDATLLQAVGMFNVFANDGIYKELCSISWIKDRWGTRIYRESHNKERVMDSRVISQVKSVLGLGLMRIKKAYGSNWIDSQAISKTGTTNDSRTCWMIGSTPDLTTGIYIGLDTNESMQRFKNDNVYPIKTAFPIWLSFNQSIPSLQKTFFFDPSLQKIIIDEYTGLPCQEGKLGAISILM